MSAQILTVKECRRCGKFRHPSEFVGGPFGFCLQCLERHKEAMAMTQYQMPAACQECGVSVEELAARSGQPDIRMEMHVKDGIYQLLCGPCGSVYATKRADLYRNTPFGDARKI